MREGRAALLDGSTLSVLSGDVKVFVRRDGSRLAMSQIEAPNAASLGARSDVSEALDEITRNTDSIAALANLVDTTLGQSLLICSNAKIKDELREKFDVFFDDNNQAWTEEMFLRKTHLVPALIGD
jgi:inorganic pyrophosphatase/exopolyphosphatase